MALNKLVVVLGIYDTTKCNQSNLSPSQAAEQGANWFLTRGWFTTHMLETIKEIT